MKITGDTEKGFDPAKRLQRVALVAGNVLEERFLAELVAFMVRSACGDWSVTFKDPTGKEMLVECKSGETPA